MSSLSMLKEKLQPMFTVQSANRTETGAKINDIVCNYVFLHGFLFRSKRSLEIKNGFAWKIDRHVFLNKLFVRIRYFGILHLSMADPHPVTGQVRALRAPAMLHRQRLEKSGKVSHTMFTLLIYSSDIDIIYSR